ncbi:MAG TPA: redoxin family protein [Candidatus Paceibacterota bacterium]|nr:redoxin family protein [Candidatus Paceibacterota bacterium]
MLLFLISFIAGILTVLAPCVLPLLPVIVGGSLAQGNRWRTYTICISLGLSVIIFTLLLKASTVFISVPQSVWGWISGGVLILFGIVMVFPKLWDNLGFVNLMNRSSNRLLATGYQRNSMWGDAIMGAALGPVFSSCSPTYFVILATVLPQSFAVGFADLFAYAVGLSGFLFIIALAGQSLVDRLGVTINPEGWFRRGIGILFVIVGLAVATGAEASTEAWLLNHGFDVTVIEQHLLGASQSDISGAPAGVDTNNASSTTSGATSGATSSASSASAGNFLSSKEKSLIYQKAPELVSPDGYINTGGQPISIGQFKGKNVVLVDFWTYSCINCIRTIPYVEMWYQKYKDQGLVIIGVHTPEFAFEHVYDNVVNATKQLGITYPVVQDNEYQTWNAFGNEYWPREYLIDIDGYIVHDHAGEGDYDVTEAAIQKALAERAARLGTTIATSSSATPQNAIAIDFNSVQSPETYFGSNRNVYLGNGQQGKAGTQSFTESTTVDPNTLYLIGTWDIEPEYAQTPASTGGSIGSDRIEYRYHAKNVYFVSGSANDGEIDVEVLQDSKPLDATNAGSDVFFKDGKSYVKISGNRLYNITKNADYGDHLLELIVSQPGLQAFTFTFG